MGSFVHEVKPWLDFAVGERVLVILWQEPYTPEGSPKRKGYYLASPAMTFALKDGLAVNKLSGESISEVLFVDMLRKAIAEVAQGP